MAAKLRVLLADDHNVVRAGLRALIEAQPDMEIVGEAEDGATACRQADELDPDLVIMDVSMPGIGGARATEQIKRDHPQTQVLALTMHEDRAHLQQLFLAGAAGYVLKRTAADDLIRAIRMVARGGTYLDPSLAGPLVSDLVGRSVGASSLRHPVLSDREEAVLRSIARGYTNREIAIQLDISVKTVETHKARAMEKLGLDSRAGIVSYAIRRGWLGED